MVHGYTPFMNQHNPAFLNPSENILSQVRKTLDRPGLDDFIGLMT